MNIAVLSGKGGTGKTTVAVNLATMLKANYWDCDVEEPNGFIFLQPDIVRQAEVQVDYPVIDRESCTLCGDCVRACQFNALFNTKKDILVFEKMCHGCRACQLVCKHQAISFAQRPIGKVEVGMQSGFTCAQGLLNVGEPVAVPVIRSLLAEIVNGFQDNLNILDCAPGTSCNAVNCLHHAQGAILVTEPTYFGLHDLKMAVTLVRKFNIPFGVVINKSCDQDDGPGNSPENSPGNRLSGDTPENRLSDDIVSSYLTQEAILLLGRIPFQRKAAERYAEGKMLCEFGQYHKAFRRIINNSGEVFAWKSP